MEWIVPIMEPGVNSLVFLPKIFSFSIQLSCAGYIFYSQNQCNLFLKVYRYSSEVLLLLLLIDYSPKQFLQTWLL